MIQILKVFPVVCMYEYEQCRFFRIMWKWSFLFYIRIHLSGVWFDLWVRGMMRDGMEEPKTLNLIKQKKSKENRENSKSFPTYHKIE